MHIHIYSVNKNKNKNKTAFDFIFLTASQFFLSVLVDTLHMCDYQNVSRS